METYPRVNAAALTRLTAPERCLLTWHQINSPAVLVASETLVLVGQLGINYLVEGRDSRGLSVRRWDVERPAATGEAAGRTTKLP